MTTTPRMVHADDNFCCAFWNNVAIVDVWGDMGVFRMRKLGEAYRSLLGEYPQGIVVMSMIRASTPVSSSDARNEVIRFLKELGERLLHHTMVIEADGVVGLMLRSVVRGLNALLRGNRMSLHDETESAISTLAAFVATDLPRTSIAKELAAAVATVRAFHPLPMKHAAGAR